MLLNIIRIIIAASFLSTGLQAGGPNDKDLILVRHVPAKGSQHIYNKFVKTNATGVIPYNYHITLGWVKDVAPQDLVPLKVQLDRVVKKYSKATFTPTGVKIYTVNRLPTKSPLVLAPKVNEEQTFKQINIALYNELQKFNVARGKKYSFHQDVVPALYTPHITLVKSMDIKNNNLNRGQLIGLINPVVKAHPIELLQGNTVKAKAPAAKKSKPSKKVKAAKTVKSSQKAKALKKIKNTKGKVKKNPAPKKTKVKSKKGVHNKRRK